MQPISDRLQVELPPRLPTYPPLSDSLALAIPPSSTLTWTLARRRAWARRKTHPYAYLNTYPLHSALKNPSRWPLHEHCRFLAALALLPRLPALDCQRWAALAPLFPGRSGNQLRRYFHRVGRAGFITHDGSIKNNLSARARVNGRVSASALFRRSALRKFVPNKLPKIDDALLCKPPPRVDKKQIATDSVVEELLTYRPARPVEVVEATRGVSTGKRARLSTTVQASGERVTGAGKKSKCKRGRATKKQKKGDTGVRERKLRKTEIAMMGRNSNTKVLEELHETDQDSRRSHVADADNRESGIGIQTASSRKSEHVSEPLSNFSTGRGKIALRLRIKMCRNDSNNLFPSKGTFSNNRGHRATNDGPETKAFEESEAPKVRRQTVSHTDVGTRGNVVEGPRKPASSDARVQPKEKHVTFFLDEEQGASVDKATVGPENVGAGGKPTSAEPNHVDQLSILKSPFLSTNGGPFSGNGAEIEDEVERLPLVEVRMPNSRRLYAPRVSSAPSHIDASPSRGKQSSLVSRPVGEKASSTSEQLPCAFLSSVDIADIPEPQHSLGVDVRQSAGQSVAESLCSKLSPSPESRGNGECISLDAERPCHAKLGVPGPESPLPDNGIATLTWEAPSLASCRSGKTSSESSGADHSGSKWRSSIKFLLCDEGEDDISRAIAQAKVRNAKSPLVESLLAEHCVIDDIQSTPTANDKRRESVGEPTGCERQLCSLPQMGIVWTRAWVSVHPGGFVTDTDLQYAEEVFQTMRYKTMVLHELVANFSRVKISADLCPWHSTERDILRRDFEATHSFVCDVQSLSTDSIVSRAPNGEAEDSQESSGSVTPPLWSPASFCQRHVGISYRKLMSGLSRRWDDVLLEFRHRLDELKSRQAMEYLAEGSLQRVMFA